MGAVIPMKGRPKDVKDEAIVAIAGPLFGGAAAAATSLIGHSTGSQLMIALADVGFMINLFNMLPIGQMDGGRISQAISKYLLLAGLAGGAYLVYQGYIRNPIFILILLSGGFSTYSRFTTIDHGSYYRIPMAQKQLITGAYFGLILLLLIGMQLNKKSMKSVSQLRQDTGDFRVGEYEKSLSNFVTEYGEDEMFLEEPKDDFMKDYFGERER